MAYRVKIFFIVIALFMSYFYQSLVFGDAVIPDIHQLVKDADHIIVATVKSIETDGPNGKAIVEVSKWIKTQFKIPPKEYTILGILIKESPFCDLEKGSQFVLFIFDNDQLKISFSAIKIEKDGNLSRYWIRDMINPKPKTLDELVERIETIMSEAYEEKLIGQLKDDKLAGILRDEAATALGYLKSEKAFSVLLEFAKNDDIENSTITRAAMWSLFRINSEKAVPVFVDIAESSKVPGNVSLACHFLGLKPSVDPKDFERLFVACKRWKESEKESYEAFARLIQALGAMRIITPEFKTLVVEQIREGKGNAKHLSMSVAGQLKIKEALPLIKDISQNDNDADMRLSAKIALKYFEIDENNSDKE